MSTLLLTRSEIEPLLHLPTLLAELRQGFQAYSLRRSILARRERSALPGQDNASAMLLFPGLVDGIPAYTVKVHAKFPGQQPAIQGVLLLHDLQTGKLLALMDSTAITAARTGLAGALAADLLARPDASRVAIIGAGVQGALQLRSLTLVRPLSQIMVYDTLPGQAETFARTLGTELALPIQAASSLREVVRNAEIIVTATWSRQPFLFADMIRPGTHITTLGPDEPGKCEVGADLIQQGLFVCDDRELALSMGALSALDLDGQAIHAELGEIIAGTRAGRTNPDQVTIYGGVGLAFQDLVACWSVYQQAQQHNTTTTKRRIDFLA